MANESLTRETWKSLMRPALRVVDSLRVAGYGELDFRLGGGTVLMFRFDHRISKDIDLFTDDAQALGFLSPRLNDVSAALVSDYQEQANSVKLILPEGDIDIIVAGTVTRARSDETLAFEGRSLPLDTTAEILAKKLLFRAESFKARDVFDMSAALSLDRPSAVSALEATRSVHDVLRRRLAGLRSFSHSELLADIILTENGARFAAGMIERLEDALREVQDNGVLPQ